jgi:CelD/BcsL family acetyltransferase involved in cellulose biosynthesis
VRSAAPNRGAALVDVVTKNRATQRVARCRSLDYRKPEVSRYDPAAWPQRPLQELNLKSKIDRSIQFRREVLPPLSILESEWRCLERIAAPSFFISWHWIGTFLAALPESRRPDLLRGSLRGKTVALALLGAKLVRRRRGLIRSRALFLNETGDADYDLTIEHNGLLAPPRYRQAATDALIGWFAESAEHDTDELYIRGSMQKLPGDAVAQYRLYWRRIEVPSYWVELDRLAMSDGELYPVLSSNARQQLRRAVRHFERFGKVRLDRAANPGEAHEFFAKLKELHIATWQRRDKPHAFSRPFFEVFHHELIDRHVANGGVQILRASAGSRLIGYLYNFRLSERIYTYQSGFAYGEPGARPGAVAHALAIRDAYKSGASAYDFLAGRNRLKESYATASEAMLWEVIQQPRLAFRAERLARSVKQQFEAQLVALGRCKKMLPVRRQGDRDASSSPRSSRRETIPPRL